MWDHTQTASLAAPRRRKFYMVVTKTSRPYEMDFHLGRYPIHLQRWSATWRAKGMPNQSTAWAASDPASTNAAWQKALFPQGGILLRQQRAQTVFSSRRASASRAGRGREGAIEEHITGKWHVIALQEAIEHLQHECLTNHFYITMFTRTFKVSSRSPPPHWEWAGWVLLAVISLASFRRIPRNGKPCFTMMSLHIKTFRQEAVASERTCCLQSVL